MSNHPLELGAEAIHELVEDVARDANRIIPELAREGVRRVMRSILRDSADLWDLPNVFAVTLADHLQPLARREELEDRLAHVLRWNLEPVLFPERLVAAQAG